jgi:histidinol-phosphate aminotransferase
MSAEHDRDDLVARWIKPAVRAMHAYPVAPSQGLIKLDAMENPYPWPQEMVTEWLETLRDVEVNRYPDASAQPLKQALAQTLALPGDLELLLGNGSDELIQLLVMAVGGPGRCVLSPEPSFVMYRMVCQFTDTDFVGVPLRQDWSLDLDAMLEAVHTHQPALVFMAYPNNPTGNLFDGAAMDAVIRAAPGLVVVDEAYEPFAGVSYADRVEAFPNLLVMRTVSKLGLAGLRLGLLMGAPAWIRELDKLRLPYNINVLSQLTARFALRHYAELRAQTDTIRRDRARLHQALGSFPGLQVWPSEANFLLVRVRDARAREVAARLREEGLLVRVLDGAADALAGCLRISVGTPEQNQALLLALEKVLPRMSSDSTEA